MLNLEPKLKQAILTNCYLLNLKLQLIVFMNYLKRPSLWPLRVDPMGGDDSKGENTFLSKSFMETPKILIEQKNLFTQKLTFRKPLTLHRLH